VDGGNGRQCYEVGTDTFVVRDGKIALQSFGWKTTLKR
jgi:hypothetical protein